MEKVRISAGVHLQNNYKGVLSNQKHQKAFIENHTNCHVLSYYQERWMGEKPNNRFDSL